MRHNSSYHFPLRPILNISYFIKNPIVRRLQSRGVNVYKIPVLSSEAPPKREITEQQRELLAADVNADLVLLAESTGFDCSKWHIQ